MPRTHVLSLLLLTAAGVAGADETATSTPTAAASVSKTTLTASSEPADGKAKPADGNAKPAAAASHEGQSGGDVKMSGMSILGNEDAPKSLVIVPWKSSQLGDMPSVSRLLDDSTQPVDKDVFMRELAYYEFKSGSK